MLKCLIAEDHLLSRRILKELLSQHDCAKQRHQTQHKPVCPVGNDREVGFESRRRCDQTQARPDLSEVIQRPWPALKMAGPMLDNKVTTDHARFARVRRNNPRDGTGLTAEIVKLTRVGHSHLRRIIPARRPVPECTDDIAGTGGVNDS